MISKSGSHPGKVFEELDEAVILVDTRDRRIRGTNPAAQRIFGYASGELIGRSTEILHIDRQHPSSSFSSIY